MRKSGREHLSLQTDWCPAAPRTCSGAAAEHHVRPTAPSLKTQADCKRTEFHQGRLIPSRHLHPSLRGLAAIWRRSDAPRAATTPAGSLGPRWAPCWAPIFPGCRSQCTWVVDGWRCSSAARCWSRHLRWQRFSPTGLNAPTAPLLACPSWCSRERPFFLISPLLFHRVSGRSPVHDPLYNTGKNGPFIQQVHPNKRQGPAANQLQGFWIPVDHGCIIRPLRYVSAFSSELHQ